MAMTKQLTDDDFYELYELKFNHILVAQHPECDPEDVCGFSGKMFETYGEELEFVCKQDPKHIWTIIDGDDGEYIVSGFHRINRVGYLISETPCKSEFEEYKLDF